MAMMRLSPDSVIGDSLRRLPGVGAVTIVTWLAPLIPASGAVLYVTASSPSWGSIAAASAVVSILAVGPVWWFLRNPLRRLPRTPGSGLLCLVAYAGLGFLGGIIVVAVIGFGAPDSAKPDMLSTPSILITTTVMTMVLSGFIVIATSWREDLRTALAVAQARRNHIGHAINQRDLTDSAERQELATAIDVEIIEPLVLAEERIAAFPAAVSDELEDIAGDVVRPLSHRFHSADSTQLTPLALTGFPLPDSQVPEVPIRGTLRRPLRAGIPIWLLTIISIPGSLLIALTDPLAAWWVPPVNLATILCALALVSYVPPALAPRVPPGWKQWLTLVGLYCAVGLVTGLVLALIIGQSIADLVLTAISFHVVTGLVASAGKTWWMSTREEQRRFNAESLALRAEDLKMLAHAHQLRTRAAMILHSQVQTRLLAIASLLAGKDPLMDHARDALRDIRDHVLISLRDDVLSSSVPGATSLDAEELRRSFPGVTITMHVEPSRADLDIHPRASIISDLITEAVANAIRHGHASVIEINVTVDEEIVHISVVDNGDGVGVDDQIVPGLGLSVVREVSSRWSLSTQPAGGVHLQVQMQTAN